MGKSFFIQHKLLGIINGNDVDLAGNVLPQAHDGESRLADGSILQREPSLISSDEIKAIWDWNNKHTLVYGFLMGSLIDEPAAYEKVIDCTTAHDVWTTLSKEFGQSSNVMLRVPESQLTTLYKKDDTMVSDHVDNYSQLIERINYHLKPTEKWSNGRINRAFFGTLNSEQWGAYEDGLAKTVNKMLPSELYAKIKARDTAKLRNKQRDAATTMNGDKEANFTNKDLKSHIDDKGPCNGHGRRNKRSKNTSHPLRSEKAS